MNRLQFATLLSWAGEDGLNGRKRLQKIVFALQQIGCPLDSHFILHHYGPYSPKTSKLLAKTDSGGKLKPFEAKAKVLLKENLWTLELGSTILYYYGQNRDWDNAMTRACDFKKKSKDTKSSQRALTFARELIAPSD